jgi:hypothetical protein
MYRVRKSWADAASQLGAYDLRQNADIAVDGNSGYYVFDDSGLMLPTTMFFWGKLKKKAGKYKKGQSVRVFRNPSRQWVLRDGTVIKRTDVDLTKQVYKADFRYPNELAEQWVNTRGYDSPTNKLFWCNKYGQRVYIFTGSKGNWHIEKVYRCGTGNIAHGDGSDSPISFAFKVWDKNKAFKGPYGIQKWNQHYSSAHGNSIHQGSVGHPSTNGCIALASQAAQWVFHNVPINTKVIVW